MCVEGRNRREDDSADLGSLRHQTQMPQVQRRLADREEQRASFLQRHIGGAGEQIVGVTVGDGRERLHRARRDEHPLCGKRAAGNGRSEVLGTIDARGECREVCGGKL